MRAYFAKKVNFLSERHNYDLTFALGILLTLAIPPIGFFPIVFLAIPILMWATAKSKNALQAFLGGWTFGLGYFLVGFYWSGIALKEIHRDIFWFFPFFVVALPVYIAIYYGFVTMLAFYFRKHLELYVLIFAALFFWFEYLRGIITNFPWNVMGSVWYEVLPVIQSLSLFGIYGLTFLAILWAGLPFLLANRGWATIKGGLGLVIVLLFALNFTWGGWRMIQGKTSFNDDVAIKVFHPHITSEMKKNGGVFDQYLEMIQEQPSNSSESTTLYVFPETSFDVYNGEYQQSLTKIVSNLPDNGYAAIGIHRIEGYGPEKNIYNSLILTDKSANILATYDKFIPAIWGEYLPFDDFISQTPLGKYTTHMLRIAPGFGPMNLQKGDIPRFSPVICFEAAFSGRIIDKESARPEFLLLLSNDAWASGSVGPYQNFSSARMRAIEEGLPVIRAANVGISAVFDPYGRELERLGMHEKGVIDSSLPIYAEPTFFSKYGHVPVLWFMGGLTFILLCIGLVCRNRP